MPLVGEFHGHYWRAKANAIAPSTYVGRPGYPVWQAAVISMVIWGPPQLWAWLGQTWDRLRWVWHLGRLLWAWPPDQRVAIEVWVGRLEAYDRERRGVLERVALLLESPRYDWARQAVRTTAGTLNFNDEPRAALAYSRLIKQNAGRRENVFRHVQATELLTAQAEAAGDTLTNPDRHLTAELAYCGFQINPRG